MWVYLEYIRMYICRCTKYIYIYIYMYIHLCLYMDMDRLILGGRGGLLGSIGLQV